MFSSSSSATEVSVDISHEFLHGLAAVVAGHVVVEVLPQSLDTIVIRAVRRQEVELYLPLPSGQCQLDLTAVMNLEVVEDDVDPACVWVGHRHQPMDQEEEQCAILAFPLDPGLTHHNGGSGLDGDSCFLVKPKLLDYMFAAFR